MKYDDATVQDIIILLSIYALPRSCTIDENHTAEG